MKNAEKFYSAPFFSLPHSFTSSSLDTFTRMNKPFLRHNFWKFFWEGIKKLQRWERNKPFGMAINLNIYPKKTNVHRPFFLLLSLYITEFALFNYRDGEIESGYFIIYIFYTFFCLFWIKKILPLSVVYMEKRFFFCSFSWMKIQSHTTQRTHWKHQTFVIFLFLFRKKSSNFLLF